MARNTTPKGKIVRRLGSNIFGNPKYDRLLKKKPDSPGPKKKRRPKMSEYGKQLVEKQKIRFSYGLSEKQFRQVFAKAKAMMGVTGDNMLVLLERRLDNAIYRLGMASTRSQARQLIAHGHIKVNGHKVDIASYLVKINDEISVVEKEKSQNLAKRMISLNPHQQTHEWVDLNKDSIVGKIVRYPKREEIPTIADEQIVVEFYSK
jgi:small subunit ribosomal protein S4